MAHIGPWPLTLVLRVVLSRLAVGYGAGAAYDGRHVARRERVVIRLGRGPRVMVLQATRSSGRRRRGARTVVVVVLVISAGP